jgi:hypothetical protein
MRRLDRARKQSQWYKYHCIGMRYVFCLVAAASAVACAQLQELRELRKDVSVEFADDNIGTYANGESLLVVTFEKSPSDHDERSKKAKAVATFVRRRLTTYRHLSNYKQITVTFKVSGGPGTGLSVEHFDSFTLSLAEEPETDHRD